MNLLELSPAPPVNHAAGMSPSALRLGDPSAAVHSGIWGPPPASAPLFSGPSAPAARCASDAGVGSWGSGSTTAGSPNSAVFDVVAVAAAHHTARVPNNTSPFNTFSSVFEDVTNVARNAANLNRSGSNNNNSTHTQQQYQQHHKGATATAAASTVLARGNFLCASKLLEIAAAASSQRSESDASSACSGAGGHPQRGPTHRNDECNDDDYDESRCSTPLSVANAVLYGEDDSPDRATAAVVLDSAVLHAVPSYALPAYQLQQQQQQQWAAATAVMVAAAAPTSATASPSPSRMDRQFSTFSVSACDSSRESTPVTPSAAVSGGAVAMFAFPTVPPAPTTVMSGGEPSSRRLPPGITFTTKPMPTVAALSGAPSVPAAAAVSAHAGTMRRTQYQTMHYTSNNTTTSNTISGVTNTTTSNVGAIRVSQQQTVSTPPPPQQQQQRKPPAELPGPQSCVMILEFKMGRRLRCRTSLTNLGAHSMGQYFIVQIDSNGFEDAGVCVGIVQLHERHTLHRVFGHSDQATILRAATPADCTVINETLPALEEVALQRGFELIHFLHLPFVCVDAEYTFDGCGCRLYYALAPQACTSIVPNVSRLQRELSFKLKCKATLEQVRGEAAVS